MHELSQRGLKKSSLEIGAPNPFNNNFFQSHSYGQSVRCIKLFKWHAKKILDHVY